MLTDHRQVFKKEHGMLSRSIFLGVASICCAAQMWGDSLGTYKQTNLVSNIPGLAANTDPNLVNPWGISESGASPFWVSDNGTGLATLYNSAGTPQSLVVTIPNPGGETSAPTGQLFNGTGKFNGDNFIFATENGTIAGWRGALGTTAETLFNSSSSGAVYKGVALTTNAQGSYILAADFHNNSIDVFPSAGAGALPGKFTDPTLPAGYAPFNVQNINGQVFVTYAKQGTGADEQAGAGLGFVSVFDTNGNFVGRVASNGALNAPWGLAIAPSSWGSLSGDLLVGNFGDGTINAYTLNGTFVGTLGGLDGNPLMNDGLWGLTFGNGGNGGSVNSLYLTAGLNDEADGLFARIDPTPEPGTFALLGLGLSGALVYRSRCKRVG
jgi:uncharacterized protein (TIGR03118 family)